MDELCKLLADKLGIVADASASWLQTAIPQYAEMMAIQTTFYAAACFMAFVLCLALLAFFLLKLKEYEDFTFNIILVTFFGILAGAASIICIPDAICWHVTPDAMLLKELVGAVK